MSIFEPGYTVGMLAQEPQLDAEKDRAPVRRRGGEPLMDLVAAYDATWDELGEATDDAAKERISQRQAEFQDQIEHLGAWDVGAQVDQAMDALRCPEPDASVRVISGGERRRVALARLLLQSPTSCCWMSRRTILMRRRCNGSNSICSAMLAPSCRDARPVLFGQRGRVDPRARPWPRDPVARKLLLVARAEAAAGWPSSSAPRTGARRRWRASSNGSFLRQGRQAKGQARINAYERMLQENVADKEREFEILIPPGPRLGRLVVDAAGVAKAFGDNLLFDN